MAHAGGWGSHASGLASRAVGEYSHAVWEAQQAWAGGGQLGSQASKLVLQGATPGSVGSESVELMFGQSGNQYLDLTLLGTGIAYTAIIEVTANNATDCMSWTQNYLFQYLTAGAPTLIGSGPATILGSTLGLTWTMAVIGATTPDRLAVTFTTGATAAAVHVACNIRLIQVT
jgi:hypothetical protein